MFLSLLYYTTQLILLKNKSVFLDVEYFFIFLDKTFFCFPVVFQLHNVT